jgi:hypothetical protein
VGFVVDKVPMGHVSPRLLLFFAVNFIPPVLQYLEKGEQLIIFLIFITRVDQ